MRSILHSLGVKVIYNNNINNWFFCASLSQNQIWTDQCSNPTSWKYSTTSGLMALWGQNWPPRYAAGVFKDEEAIKFSQVRRKKDHLSLTFHIYIHFEQKCRKADCFPELVCSHQLMGNSFKPESGAVWVEAMAGTVLQHKYLSPDTLPPQNLFHSHFSNLIQLFYSCFLLNRALIHTCQTVIMLPFQCSTLVSLYDSHFAFPC